MTEDGPVKLQVLWHFIQKNQIDIFTFMEHNTCWDLTLAVLHLPALTKGWWENVQWCVSYMEPDPCYATSTRQYMYIIN